MHQQPRGWSLCKCSLTHPLPPIHIRQHTHTHIHTTGISYKILTARILFFLIKYSGYTVVYRILPKFTTAVQKKVLLRKEEVQHKNEECTLCDACVWLQCRGKSSGGGEARGGMIVISAVKFEMLRWQISAVSACSDADRYQHTLAIPPLPPTLHPRMDTTTSRGSDEPTDSECCKLFLERITKKKKTILAKMVLPHKELRI